MQSPPRKKTFYPGGEYIFKYIRFLPIFDPQKKIALLCSGKSGSTFAVKWFLFQVDMLEAAEFYSSWIHDFRTAVFYESNTYKTRIDEIFNPDILTIKYVRNRYHRAVSTYLNLCRARYNRIYGAGVPASASMILGKLEQFLNRKFDAENSFSFIEFLHYLDHIDVENYDIHLMKQSANRAFENALKNLVILKLEDSIEQLPVIEKEYGLKPSNISALKTSLHHTNQDKINVGYCGDQMFKDKITGRLPEYRNFYNQQGIELVKKIYGDDFTVYQYSADAI